ncbi:MAG: corrinoid protein [Planctomycetaceae bacterium]|jgi:corrinoid protein of di/trimethylamine methyltransferase|nr:corrinoid protein [Planctomycetaceae bacterium]
MGKTKDELYSEMSDAVVNMEEELSAQLSNEAVESGYDAFEAIDLGLAKGMEQAGRLFDDGEYFVPELLMCADALNAGVEILKPYIKTERQEKKHKIVIGVIAGDTHDIGKNLVKLMLSSAGFDVIDLGRDVPPSVFVERAVQENAKIIMISSLMTTTMDGMADVINILNEKGIRNEFKVAIGGGPVSRRFADQIGADGYSSNANQAIKMANELVGR